MRLQQRHLSAILLTIPSPATIAITKAHNNSHIALQLLAAAMRTRVALCEFELTNVSGSLAPANIELRCTITRADTKRVSMRPPRKRDFRRRKSGFGAHEKSQNSTKITKARQTCVVLRTTFCEPLAH
jgi:hypothetical protein